VSVVSPVSTVIDRSNTIQENPTVRIPSSEKFTVLINMARN